MGNAKIADGRSFISLLHQRKSVTRMPRIHFICCALLVLPVLVSAQPVASIELSDPPAENNISLFTFADPAGEPFTVQTTAGGQACRFIAATKYGYFRVNDATITPADNQLIFTITFFDAGAGFFSFQYNATNSQNYKPLDIEKTNSNKWVTATVSVTDASFRNAQNNFADFRLSGECYVRSIAIAKGVLNPAAEALTPVVASSFSEFTGKSVAGYQAWFSTGTPSGGWRHWSYGSQPAPGNQNFDVYPDVREYLPADLAPTGYAALGSGAPAQLFHSASKTVIDKHFAWMQESEIDGAALQRFITPAYSVIINTEESHLVKVKNAAEVNNRIFYICYDISSQGLSEVWDDIIKFDWVYNIEKNFGLTRSPAYAKVGNKPVVQIWGLGFTHTPGTAQETIDLVNFLKARGCYVIGGLPTNWRTGTQDSKAGFGQAYLTLDMISPWSVGRFGNVAEANTFKNNLLVPDKAYCDLQAIAYMPVIFPGFSWATWNNNRPNFMQRNAGTFFWQQALNIKSIQAQQMYFAMFDEYDEGTAIMKAATDWSMIPTNQYFVTLGADGTWVSSDFYLRLAAVATKLIKGLISTTPQVPIPHSNGPVYYRNSFESIFAVCREPQYNGFYPVDPGFFNPGLVNSAGVTGGSVAIENNAATAHSGSFAVKITGNPASATTAIFYHKIADTKIKIVPGLAFSFWKYTVNTLGRFTSIDLKFASGKVLRDLSAYKDQTGNGMHPGNGRGTVGAWEKFTCVIGTGELLGDEISEIIVAYDQPAASGNFTAFFDDVLIGVDSPPLPLSPSNILAEAQSAVSTRLTWTDNSGNESGFEIFRSEGNQQNFVLKHTAAANVTTYTDTGLQSATLYYYRVRSVNAGGASSFDGSIAHAPSAPANLAVQSFSSQQITLAWSDQSLTETGFQLFRSAGTNLNFELVQTLPPNTVTSVQTGLLPGTLYYFKVRAIAPAGRSLFSGEVAQATTPSAPAAPGALAIQSATASQLVLIWTDNSTSETGFEVQRSLQGGGPFTALQTLPPNAVTFTDTGLTPATTYFYRVRAFNDGGNSNFSSVASGTTLPLPPSAPSGLNAQVVNDSQVALTWVDNANNETGFEIQRSAGSLNAFGPIVTTGANLTSYTDTGLASGSTYFYRVRAINSGGLSAFTPVANTLVTRTNEPVGATVISVYPNPVADQLVLKNSTASGLDILIMDTFGRLITRTWCDAGSQQLIDSSGWIPGLYVIRVPELQAVVKVQKR